MHLEQLERVSEEDLRGWLLRRVRGQEQDPPLSTMHLEAPDDYVAVVHGQTTDSAFRSRLERAIVATLGEAAEGNLSSGEDAVAVKSLAELVHRRHLREALPILVRVAERGLFGGHEGVLETRAEEAVLFALAGLQERKVLWRGWKALWDRPGPEVLPLVAVGLRLSDPQSAILMLPAIVEQAIRQPDFPLGEVLWGFVHDPELKAEDITTALKALRYDALEKCRHELREVGATEDQIEAWIPTPPSGVTWTHLDRKLPLQPPRLKAIG